MRFAFIHAEKAYFPLTALCRLLGVSRQGYYRFAKRPASARVEQEAALREQIRAVHQDSAERYGSPRVLRELHRQGVNTSKRRVERAMRSMGLRARPTRHFRVTTAANPLHAVEPNRLARDFTASRPDQRWVTDITYVWTDEGWCYLAAILDLFSRSVVGWALDTTLSTTLPLKALEVAVARRRPTVGLVHHSDRGCQGGINRSSQHLDTEELRWVQRSVDGRLVRGVLRCVHQGVPRRGDVSTGSDSGRQSTTGCPARTLRRQPVSHSRSGRGGSARVAGCRRSAWPRSRGAICRSRSAKKSRYSARSALGYARSREDSAAPRRRFRASCAATPRPVVEGSSIGRRLRSGTPTARRDARKWRSWLRATSCKTTCRTDWQE
jgi:putative transposase